jgi:hypothetical protein
MRAGKRRRTAPLSHWCVGWSLQRETSWRCCQSNVNSSLAGPAVAGGRAILAYEGLPFGQGGRTAFLVGLAVDLVALEVEVIVDVGVNLFHQKRTVSWQRSMPRSNSGSSPLRDDSGKRTYICTTRRITSGDELKHRNGLAPDDRVGRAEPQAVGRHMVADEKGMRLHQQIVEI